MVELLVCMTITGFTMSAMVAGYILAARKAEWTTVCSAAHRLAARQMEQAKGATSTNRLYSLAGTLVETLELPEIGADPLTATVTTTINRVSLNTSVLSGSPHIEMHAVRVECVWDYTDLGPFTNVVCGYCLPVP